MSENSIIYSLLFFYSRMYTSGSHEPITTKIKGYPDCRKTSGHREKRKKYKKMV